MIGLGSIIAYFTGRQADKNFWRNQQQEFKRMAHKISFRDQILTAINHAPGVKLTAYSVGILADAVMAVIDGEIEIATIGDIPGIPVMIMGPPGSYPHLQPVGVRDGVRAEIGLDPEPSDTATGARAKLEAEAPLRAFADQVEHGASGWRIVDYGDTKGGALSGMFYASGPDDLRIRTNDGPLLDRILLLLEDEKAIIKRMSEDPRLMERVAAKAGVDLGGNPLETPDEKLQRQARDLVLTLCDWFDINPNHPQIESAARVTHQRLQRLVSKPAVAALEEPAYLIWSNQHRLWWRPESKGYCRDLASAGRYTMSEALEICRSSRDGWKNPPDEVPVRENDALFCAAP